MRLNSYLFDADERDLAGLEALPRFLSRRGGSAIADVQAGGTDEAGPATAARGYLDEALACLRSPCHASRQSKVSSEPARRFRGRSLRNSDRLPVQCTFTAISNERASPARGHDCLPPRLTGRGWPASSTAGFATRQPPPSPPAIPLIVDAFHLTQDEREATAAVAVEAARRFTGIWLDALMFAVVVEIPSRGMKAGWPSRCTVRAEFADFNPDATETPMTRDQHAPRRAASRA